MDDEDAESPVEGTTNGAGPGPPNTGPFSVSRGLPVLGPTPFPAPGAVGISPLLFEPAESTPLDDQEHGDAIPPAPLWAMRSRAHGRRLPPDDPGFVAASTGAGDEAVYLMDDGPKHCMIGRRVGRSPDGCVYCLVARITMGHARDLVDEEAAPAEAFADAHDIALCGVYSADRASNVILVQHYRHLSDVPADYLPPSPFIEFT